MNNAQNAVAPAPGAGEIEAAEEAALGAGTTVVVGAARGIGAAVARHLAAAPWTERIVLADIDVDGISHLAGEIGADGLPVDVQSIDVTDEAQISKLLSLAPDAKRLAIVSGVFQPAPALEVSQESFRRIVEVNLFGAFFLAQRYAQAMIAGGGGAIVGVASIAARMPRFRQVAYCASKAGMRQALRVLGAEVAVQGVRVNTVSPGATDTPMMRSLLGDHPDVSGDLAMGSLESMRPRIPAGRVANPDDVAGAVTYLLSPSAGHLVLQDIVVDGGELLGM